MSLSLRALVLTVALLPLTCLRKAAEAVDCKWNLSPEVGFREIPIDMPFAEFSRTYDGQYGPPPRDDPRLPRVFQNTTGIYYLTGRNVVVFFGEDNRVDFVTTSGETVCVDNEQIMGVQIAPLVTQLRDRWHWYSFSSNYARGEKGVVRIVLDGKTIILESPSPEGKIVGIGVMKTEPRGGIMDLP